MLCYCSVSSGYTIFQDNFDNAAGSTAVWPGSGDYDPGNPSVGSWGILEYAVSDVQVSSYSGTNANVLGGIQPSAHSGAKYLISGYHNEYYNNWTYAGRPCANFANTEVKITADYWVWGTTGMFSQVVGYAGVNATGSIAFIVVLSGSGDVKWHDGTQYVTAAATWTPGIWNHVVVGVDLVNNSAKISVNGSTYEEFSPTYEIVHSVVFSGDQTIYYDDISISNGSDKKAAIVTSNYSNGDYSPAERLYSWMMVLKPLGYDSDTYISTTVFTPANYDLIVFANLYDYDKTQTWSNLVSPLRSWIFYNGGILLVEGARTDYSPVDWLDDVDPTWTITLPTDTDWPMSGLPHWIDPDLLDVHNLENGVESRGYSTARIPNARAYIPSNHNGIVPPANIGTVLAKNMSDEPIIWTDALGTGRIIVTTLFNDYGLDKYLMEDLLAWHYGGTYTVCLPDEPNIIVQAQSISRSGSGSSTVITFDANDIMRVNGNPFFPFGFYGVSRASTMSAMQANGFNFVHSDIDNADDYNMLTTCQLTWANDQRLVDDICAGMSDTTLSSRGLMEEPSNTTFTNKTGMYRAALCKWLDPNRPCYTLLNDGADFEAYSGLGDFTEVDPYTILTSTYGLGRIYSDITRTRALNGGKPVWALLQAHGMTGQLYLPDPAQLVGEMYVALAAGARGISWFVMDQPDDGGQSNITYIRNNDLSWRQPQWSTLCTLASEFNTIKPWLLKGLDSEISITSSNKDEVFARCYTGSTNSMLIIVNGKATSQNVTLAWYGSTTYTKCFSDSPGLSISNGVISLTMSGYQRGVYFFCPPETKFQANFESDTTSTTAWPNTSADYDPGAAIVGNWGIAEPGAYEDVQVTSYSGSNNNVLGGIQPSAHSGSKYMISGYHYEYYGNWNHAGLPCANLVSEVREGTVDFWVWGRSGMFSQIVGYAGANAAGNGAFFVVLDGTGRVRWYNGSNYITANATWTPDTWNHVVITVDLTADSGSISVNNSTPQSFSPTYGSDTTMGSVRFYGDYTSYYDDILITSKVIHFDDFETTTAETGAPRQGIDADPVGRVGWWWVKDRDNVYDEQVTSYATPGAHGGSKYLRLTNPVDSQAKAILNVNGALSSDFTASFWVYTGFKGFRLFTRDASENYGLFLSWGEGTAGYINYLRNGAWNATSCTYSLNQWQHVVLTFHYNVLSPTVDITVGNSSATGIPFYDSTKSSVSSILFAGGDASAYACIDDVLVTK
jgi:hypothetical protein